MKNKMMVRLSYLYGENSHIDETTFCIEKALRSLDAVKKLFQQFTDISLPQTVLVT